MACLSAATTPSATAAHPYVIAFEQERLCARIALRPANVSVSPGGLKRAAPAGGMISRGSDSGRARAMSRKGGGRKMGRTKGERVRGRELCATSGNQHRKLIKLQPAAGDASHRDRDTARCPFSTVPSPSTISLPPVSARPVVWSDRANAHLRAFSVTFVRRHWEKNYDNDDRARGTSRRYALFPRFSSLSPHNAGRPRTDLCGPLDCPSAGWIKFTGR